MGSPYDSQLYLEYYEVDKNENGSFLMSTSVETYLVYFVAKYCEYPSRFIIFVKNKAGGCLENNNPARWIFSESSNGNSFIEKNKVDKKLMFCIMPFLADRKISYIRSGLCCVLRSIVLSKLTDFVDLFLLGPSKCCLKACAEVSQWTMLCEHFIPECLKNHLICKEQVSTFFEKIENLLSRPSKICNVKKIQRHLIIKHIHLNSADLTRYHPYIEGVNFTLTDVVIYSSVLLMIQNESRYKDEILLNFPKLAAYFSTLNENPGLNKVTIAVFDQYVNFPKLSIDLLPTNKWSDYSQTKQVRISSALQSYNDILSKFVIFEFDTLFTPFDAYMQNWSDLSIPCNQFDKIKDMMPESRFERKCDQLKNMVRPVIYFSNKINSVVDFCAGSGQLGVLISFLLPNHDVMLVENKEESISKALRVASEAKNITIYQTNLDHFQQPFDLGICLHGCGFVSDLVLQKCLEQRAIFVICPCCYGSLKETSNVTYPQSNKLKQIFSYSEFISVAHNADQTEKHITKEEMGKLCMSIVDLDRSLKAQENNYKTVVYKMIPENCSPKNNMIVGIPIEKLC